MRVLPHARAHWLTRDADRVEHRRLARHTYILHSGERENVHRRFRSHFSLALDPAGLSRELREKYPTWRATRRSFWALCDLAQVPELVESQLAVSRPGTTPTGWSKRPACRFRVCSTTCILHWAAGDSLPRRPSHPDRLGAHGPVCEPATFSTIRPQASMSPCPCNGRPPRASGAWRPG